MEEKTVKVITCKRCNHSWIPRVKKVLSCPACKSYGYLTEKRK